MVLASTGLGAGRISPWRFASSARTSISCTCGPHGRCTRPKKEKLAAQGPLAVASAEFSSYVRGEIARWARVIAATGLKIK
jgi:hypothetical protein